MSIDAKICGLRDQRGIDAALAGGARYCGLVFFPRSPRFVTPADAGPLAMRMRGGGARSVGVFVDPDDALLASVLATARLDYVQLHGRESPARAAEIARTTGCRVIKALSVSAASDIASGAAYRGGADMILFDAKPPAGDRNALPGGNARAFDWRLFRESPAPAALPWILSGGLTVDNVAEAIKITGARAVDVSSGVESAPGEKDPGKIRSFLAALERAEAGITRESAGASRVTKKPAGASRVTKKPAGASRR